MVNNITSIKFDGYYVIIKRRFNSVLRRKELGVLSQARPARCLY